MSLTRRDVLKAAGAAAASAALPALGQKPAAIERRALGKTGFRAAIYALGSAEMPSPDAAQRAIHRMLDAGVNYLDTAPSYQGTRSERTIGEVMKTRRKEVFLATKTLERSAEGAYAEIKQSLERLQTKQIDCLQIHAVNDFGTLERVLSATGAIKGLERAKKEGLIRFLGITGHTRPEVIAKALDEYPFDTILVPVSALDASLHDFAAEVLPQANKLGVAVVGMKALKGIERATGGRFEPADFLRYAWSLPLATLTIGLRQEKEAEENLRMAQAFGRMPSSEMRALERRMAEHADAGNLWWKRR
jgi:uncharacterized protein